MANERSIEDIIQHANTAVDNEIERLGRDWARFVDALHAIRGSKSHDEAVRLAREALNVVLPAEPTGNRCFACGHSIAPVPPEVQQRLDVALAAFGPMEVD